LPGIREPDVHRSNAEDRDDHWLFSIAGHTVVVPGACVAQDKSAIVNRYGLCRREVSASVDLLTHHVPDTTTQMRSVL
jgi:hypothetical protein